MPKPPRPALALYLSICYQLDNHPDANTTLQLPRATTHTTLGRLYHASGNLKQAEAEYLLALDLFYKVWGVRRNSKRKMEDVDSAECLEKDEGNYKQPPVAMMRLLEDLIKLCEEHGKGGMKNIYEAKLSSIKSASQKHKVVKK